MRKARHKKAAMNTAKNLGRSAKKVGSAWSSLFASKTLVALLKVFITSPEKSFYQNELASMTGAGRYTVQRELLRLEQAGLITTVRRGNRVYYSADRSHPAFEDLKRMFLKTVSLGDALRAGLSPLATKVRVAFVYGSYASGLEKARSDIDLMIVGDLGPREASDVLGPLGRELGVEFNPVVYPVNEFKAKVKEGHHFVMEVLKGPKIFLIGDEGEIRELIG